MSRTIILKELRLENFKGRSMSMKFSNGRTIIKGTNEAGKSTLTNAFFWLLTGVDALDRTNYELFDATLDFSPDNAILAVVEGVFEIDGVEYKLRRTAKPKWVRKRGKGEYEKAASDEYSFGIDDLAVSSAVYKERVETLFAPIDKLKLMLNVRYYQSLEWKKLRKHFADMVGVVDESELSGDYSEISALLEKYKTVDAVKEKLRQEIAPLKNSVESISAEIKGMKATLPSLDGVAEAEQQCEEKRARMAEIDREIVGLSDANKPYIEKRNSELKAISDKKNELILAMQRWKAKYEALVDPIRRQITEIDAKNREIEARNDACEKERRYLSDMIERDKATVRQYELDIEELRKRNAAMKEQLFDEIQVCPTCGQPLSAEKIEEARTAFYDQREAKRAMIIETGRTKVGIVEKIKKNISENMERMAAIPAPSPKLSVETLSAELKAIEYIPFEESPEYAALSAEIADLEANLTVIPTVDSLPLLEEKKLLNDEIIALSEILSRVAERERVERLIKNKESELGETGVKLGRLEGLFDKCVEREREWASIVRDRANKHLYYSHIEMLEMTKGGDLVDVCNLTARKVGSGTQNNATQILIGVDVARAFQENAGVSIPIFIDNAEGIVNSNLPTDVGQMILLYVDEDYKQLTICK